MSRALASRVGWPFRWPRIDSVANKLSIVFLSLDISTIALRQFSDYKEAAGSTLLSAVRSIPHPDKKNGYKPEMYSKSFFMKEDYLYLELYRSFDAYFTTPTALGVADSSGNFAY